MKIKAGDWVRTPRFCNVKIERVYPSVTEMYEAGYTEPTHFHEDGCEVYGKSIGINRMVFAAASAND